MKCIVIYATGMYSYLSKISSAIKILILDTNQSDPLYLREEGWGKGKGKGKILPIIATKT
jgi:hypothetical protein